jgi:putative acetyltransferase
MNLSIRAVVSISWRAKDNRMLTIRPEEPGDQAAIHHVNTLAFGQPQEADLVAALRSNGGLTISLVAVQDGRIVGHIAFSPVTITSDSATIDAIGLAPMAVLPEYQRLGIGSQLVEAGLHACHNTPYGVVVVLGHAHYYPRFGFTPAKPYRIVWEHKVLEEVFMVQELKAGALAQTRGVVKYRPEFDSM